MRSIDIPKPALRSRSLDPYIVSSLQRIVPRLAYPEQVTAQLDLRRVKCVMIAQVIDTVHMTILTRNISVAGKRALGARTSIADFYAI